MAFIWWYYHDDLKIPISKARLKITFAATKHGLFLLSENQSKQYVTSPYCNACRWVANYNDVIMSAIASQITSLTIIQPFILHLAIIQPFILLNMHFMQSPGINNKGRHNRSYECKWINQPKAVRLFVRTLDYPSATTCHGWMDWHIGRRRDYRCVLYGFHESLRQSSSQTPNYETQ